MGSGVFPIAARPHASGPEASARSSGRCRDATICVLLGILAFVVYNANLRAISAADTYAARYLPFSIWRHHTLALDPIATSVAQGRVVPDTALWIVKARGDHLVSLYPVVVPVVLAPLYRPVLAWLDRQPAGTPLRCAPGPPPELPGRSRDHGRGGAGGALRRARRCSPRLSFPNP